MKYRKLTALLALTGLTALLAAAPALTVGAQSRAAIHRHVLIAQPSSIGAAGDSITNAFDVNSNGALQKNPQYSWSTGTIAAVDSQYQRILAKNAKIKGKYYNVAGFGAKMKQLDAQMKTLAADKVGYATVLMGDDDVCTPTIAAMTPVATFKTQFEQALHDFFAKDDSAHVYVSSIADVYRVWQLFHSNTQAEYLWNTLAPALTGQYVCHSMLNPKATAAQRQVVRNREIAYNAALAAVCKSFSHCRWDGDANFNRQFTAKDISTVDYISPSVQGQADLATSSWAHSYWPGTK